VGRRKGEVAANDLTIYDTFADFWWSGEVRWLRVLRTLVPARLHFFETIVPDWTGLRVLDLGCGGGFMAESLARAGASVTGVDPAEDALGAARSHAAREGLEIIYQAGHAEELGFAEGSFDVVVCVDVLEHVADLGATLDEVARVLKPGGHFLFDTINRNWLARVVIIWGAERLLRLLPAGTHEGDRFIRPAELRAALEDRSLQPLRFTGLGPTGWNRRFDLVFGEVPTQVLQYLGSARKQEEGAIPGWN